VKLKVPEGMIEVRDVRHIPGIHASLLSFSLLEAQGFDISLVDTVPKHFRVTSLDNTSFQIYANPTCGTYQVNTKGANSQVYTTTTQKLPQKDTNDSKKDY
jgi:hypothetical protein